MSDLQQQPQQQADIVEYTAVAVLYVVEQTPG